jgi:hypothetical protein
LRSESLEEAARGDIPARFARTLVSELSPDGRTAFVLLGTNEEPYLYPYAVICSRAEDGWSPGSGTSFGGIGWTSLGAGDDTGVLFFGGDAPAGAVEAVVRYRGEEHRVPVTSGFFVFVAWNVVDGDPSELALVGFVGRDP